MYNVKSNLKRTKLISSDLSVWQDKPWVFAHLLQLQRRLGKDNFPLIEQTFFPNARELVSQICSFLLDLILNILLKQILIRTVNSVDAFHLVEFENRFG